MRINRPHQYSNMYYYTYAVYTHTESIFRNEYDKEEA